MAEKYRFNTKPFLKEVKKYPKTLFLNSNPYAHLNPYKPILAIGQYNTSL